MEKKRKRRNNTPGKMNDSKGEEQPTEEDLKEEDETEPTPQEIIENDKIGDNENRNKTVSRKLIFNRAEQPRL